MQAKLIITDDKGVIVVGTDLGQIGAIEHMNSIENFVVVVKHSLILFFSPN